MYTVISFASFAFVFFILYNLLKKKKKPTQPEANIEKKILEKHIVFYQKLNSEEKDDFEKRVFKFLSKVRIQGVEVTLMDEDKVFVAAAAIIPIFAFKNWEYRNIHDVLIYPSSFTSNFKTEGSERDILGMVGNGAMENQMILSIEELRNGFSITDSKSNTAIHEFVHLIDKDDGTADGLPSFLLPPAYALPWLKRIHQEIEFIQKGKSDINPYGATNETEFLAVAAEYFFNQPHLMSQKHPQLYDLLQTMFLPEKTN